MLLWGQDVCVKEVVKMISEVAKPVEVKSKKLGSLKDLEQEFEQNTKDGKFDILPLVELDDYVPLPKGDVHKKKEVVQDVRFTN